MERNTGVALNKMRWIAFLVAVGSVLFIACGAAATDTPVPTATKAPAASAPIPIGATKAPVAIAPPTSTAVPRATATATPAPIAPSKAKADRLKIAVTPPTHETNDPSQAVLSGQTQLSPMYETLLRVTPAGEIVPMLATGYTMSPDTKTWTINLRKGVPWHGSTSSPRAGGEFTAKDLEPIQ